MQLAKKISKNFKYFEKRLSNLRDFLKEKKLPALLISSQVNRYYLTGWQGDIESGFLLVTLKKAFIITDNRYTEEVTRKVPHFDLVEIPAFSDTFWQDFFKKNNIQKIGFETKDLSVWSLKNLKKKTSRVKWIGTENLIEKLRQVKDSLEIELVEKSVRIADKSFDYILKNIASGQSEKEIAWKLEEFMREIGAQKNAWEPFIVASGANSSMVHYPAGDRKIKKGDQVLLDWGCYYQGYACDISRVIFLGSPTNKQIQIYNLVLEAQKKALEQIKPEVSTKKVDIVAREFLKSRTGDYFKHAVGHGVGLEVHELPRVNEKAKEKFVSGEVTTVEPGIYIPGWGGVRLEDMVLVTDKSNKILTKSTKDLKDIVI